MNYKDAQKQFAPLLKPLSRLYSGLMSLRAYAYTNGLLKSQKPKSFCVAVGNIAWGGSGKTPLADWLLNWAQEKGLTAALLSRGYGGKSEERPLLVKTYTAPEASGDEPLLLARRHPEAYVLADPKRRRALDLVETQTTANFIVLDDGMQHLAIQRDLNLVLLRLADLEKNWNKVIPAGEWREGAAALARASAFLLRTKPEEFQRNEELIRTRLSQFSRPIFSFYLRPCGLRALGAKAEQESAGSLPAIFGNNGAACGKAEQGGLQTSLNVRSASIAGTTAMEQGGLQTSLNGRPYVLCTGVGNPESVIEDASRLLKNAPAQTFIYPDHHNFTAQDLKTMTCGLPIVMTAKDAVKIQPLLVRESQTECYVLESEVRFGPRVSTVPEFPTWLEERWRELR